MVAPAPGTPAGTPAPGTPAPGTPAGTPAPGTPAPGTPAGTPAPKAKAKKGKVKSKAKSKKKKAKGKSSKIFSLANLFLLIAGIILIFAAVLLVIRQVRWNKHMDEVEALNIQISQNILNAQSNLELFQENSLPENSMYYEIAQTAIQTCTLNNGNVYKFYIDANGQIWQEENVFLAELKKVGGKCTFEVPNGWVIKLNQSAGVVTVNGNIADLGNPVYYNGSYLLSGNIVSTWDAGNDSAGTMITLFRK